MANNKKQESIATPSQEELQIDKTANKNSPESIEEKTAELDAREKELNEKAAEIEKLKETLSKLDIKLQQQSKEIEEKEKSLLSSKADEKSKNKKPSGLKFTFEGQSYKFKDKAPQSIRFNDNVMTQKEITEDEDVLLQLVGGNSSLIEKITK